MSTTSCRLPAATRREQASINSVTPCIRTWGDAVDQSWIAWCRTCLVALPIRSSPSVRPPEDFPGVSGHRPRIVNLSGGPGWLPTNRYGPVDCSGRCGPLPAYGTAGNGDGEAAAEELVGIMERGTLFRLEMQCRDERSSNVRACTVPASPRTGAVTIASPLRWCTAARAQRG